MPLDNLNDVRVFVQVADSGGLSAASRILGLPANTVSRTIARLEGDLGIRLLLRTTRTMSLTDEGREFYERAQSLLDAARRAEEVAVDKRAGLSGLIRVAVRTTTVQFSLVPELLALLEKHHDLRVQLLVTDDEVDLVANGLDLALKVGAQPDSTLRHTLLGHVTFVLAASPSYLKCHGRPETPDNLSQHECIRPVIGRAKSPWTLVGPRGKRTTVMVGGRFECSDVRTQREAIYAGFGIGVRPAGEVCDSKQIERVLAPWTLEPLSVHVLKPPLKPSPQRARAVEAVIELLRLAVARMSPQEHR